MNKLFSSFFSAFSNSDENSFLNRNCVLTPTQILLHDLGEQNIQYEWLTDPKDGDKTIAIFNQHRQLSLHFFIRDTKIFYCFYDRSVVKCTTDYPHTNLKDAINNFDEFILHHYNDAKKNPYFESKRT